MCAQEDCPYMVQDDAKQPHTMEIHDYIGSLAFMPNEPKRMPGLIIQLLLFVTYSLFPLSSFPTE